MRHFPLSKATLITPFLNAANTFSCDLSPLLNRFPLSENELRSNSLYLPTHVFGVISGAVAQLTERADIGYIASELAEREVLHPYFMQYIDRSQRLLDALNVIFTHYRLHGSDFGLWLEYKSNELRLCHRSTFHASHKCQEYANEYTIFLMIRLIRKYLGADWRPEYLAFEHQSNHKEQIVRQTKSRRIVYGERCNYVPIDIQLEDLPSLTSYAASSEQSAITRVTSMIDIFWEDEAFGLEFMAHLFGVSERTIQRLFIQHNTTYRDYINGKKMEKATEMLRNGATVKAVAEELNYSDPSTFSRAMKKQLNMSPTKYISYNNPYSFRKC